MCGIIGVYKKRGDAVKDVYEGLLRLEYRGYDSSGIAALEGGRLSVRKRKGGVARLGEELEGLKGGVAMGHTRWATCGQPSDINAHPHVAGKIAVVHNGIIENYASLKEQLSAEGREFLSETDSEVIAHLIDKYYGEEKNLLAATARAAGRLEGSFALCVMCGDFRGLIAVKYKSSQVIGFSGDGVYLSSDIPALPACVSEVYIPPDGTITVIDGGAAPYDFSLNPRECPRRGISAGQWSADKGNYPHFMLKEIDEAERTVRDTARSITDCGCLVRCARILSRAGEIIFTGCGTAYNAGLIAERFFARTGANCRVCVASELRYFPPKVTRDTVVIAISQSGETADTVEAVNLLRGMGACIIAVTNCGYSALTRVAHAVVPVCAHAEICVAATKSYIGQIAALYLLANAGGDVRGACEKLYEAAALASVVAGENEKAEEFARACAESKAVFFLGRGSDYSAAVEASLKLKEVSYIFSDAYPAGELKHGTLALIDENTLSVFIICEPSVAEKCVNALGQVLSRNGRAVVLTCLDEVEKSLCGKVNVWKIARCGGELEPILCAVALQKTAYYTAVKRGKDPDKPRNLAKSVTVE